MTTTFTAFSSVIGAGKAHALGQALENLSPPALGVAVFEVEGGGDYWEVSGYFAAPPDSVALAILAAAFSAQEFAVSQITDQNWIHAVERTLKPVQEGRFFIYGQHAGGSIPLDDYTIPLLIEASLAFGTGHHASTRGCLRALQTLCDSGYQASKIVDIGCGTGILAMAAAHLWTDARVYAGDCDTIALDVARANIAANNTGGCFGDRIRCYCASGLDHPALMAAAPFDIAVANIVANPLIDMVADIGSALTPRGIVILSGILNDQAPGVARAYADCGMVVGERYDSGDWTTLICHRQ